jgi:hypothetical protein
MGKRLLILAICMVVAFVSLTAPAYAVAYDIQKDLALYGYLNQNSMPIFVDPVTGLNIGCGPTSAVNSFVYLQNKYNWYYGNVLVPDNDAVAVATILGGANYMKTLTNWTTHHDDFILGKYNYLESVAPGKTVYAAQDYWAWTTARPSWVAPIAPTWQFLYNELVACEDVEILLTFSDGGHYLTLTSFHWTDADNDLIVDQSESAWIDYIDPNTGATGQSNIWQSSLGGIISCSYTSDAWISMAVKESVPEPATIVLLMLAAACGLTFRRRFV